MTNIGKRLRPVGDIRAYITRRRPQTTRTCKGRKGKWTCIAPIASNSTTKRSDVDHTELPANTPHLPFPIYFKSVTYHKQQQYLLAKRRKPERTSANQSWHLTKTLTVV